MSSPSRRLKTGDVRVDEVPVPARRAGQHAREMTRRKAGRALLALAALISTAGFGVLVGGLTFGQLLAVELLVLAGVVLLDRVVVPEVERWGRGAAGEEHVGRLLAELEGDGYLTIHDVGTGGGNIDTVLVGPAGLFTIEVKSHGGGIRSDRIDPAWLRQAHAQKMWLERVAQRPATPLLVMSAGRSHAATRTAAARARANGPGLHTDLAPSQTGRYAVTLPLDSLTRPSH